MIAIVDYGLGNTGSIVNMLNKIGTQALVSSDPAALEKADKIILPGVGSFDSGMGGLQERDLIPVLNRLVLEEYKPVLGLCLGMQLFAKQSEEGQQPGLGWLNAHAIRFKFDAHNQLKIPHMGWNTIVPCRPDSLWDHMGHEMRFYFAHAYHMVCEDQNDILATAHYGFDFPAMVARGNIIGAQFHPEKSHKFGMRLLANFIAGM